MKIVYATVKEEDFEFDKEYFAIVEGGQKGTESNVYLYTSKEESEEAMKFFKTDNFRTVQRARLARVIFTAKSTDSDAGGLYE